MTHVATTTNASASLSRYSSALMQIGITLLAAFVLLPVDVFGETTSGIPAALGLLSVAVGAVLTYLVPLLGERQSSILKVAIPVVMGGIAALIQFIAAGDFSTTAIAFLVLTVLNSLASKLGVEIRKDALGSAA